MKEQTLTETRSGGFKRRHGGVARHYGGFVRQHGGFGRQRGGFAVGLIVGLLIGLGLALGVALYVTKVPIPFVNKVPQRTAVHDAAEAEKNRNWDPNSPLYGKNPARPSTGASGVAEPLVPALTPPPVTTTVTTTQVPSRAIPLRASASASAPAQAGRASASAPAQAARASAPSSARDPAAILADRPVPKSAAPGAAATGADPFSYFVQAGAYARTEDADQQRANLTMLGLEGRITEREQSGRTVYRVRVGPFEKKADADAAKETLGAAGVEAQLVRVQR